MNAILCLIDESILMDVKIKPKDATRKPLHKMSSVANSINGFLKRLSVSQSDCKVAVLGYSTDQDDKASVESKLNEGLVSVSDLESLVRHVETRVQKIPSGDGFTFNSKDVEVPVWYEPNVSGKSCQVAGFEFSKDFLSKCDGLESATIVHVFGGASGDGNPVRCIKSLEELGLTSLTIFQVHVGSTESVPATSFPAKQITLTSSFARDLFNRATPLDDQWRNALRKSGFAISNSAQSLVYNSHLVDLAKLFSSIEQVASTWTARTDTAASAIDSESFQDDSIEDVAVSAETPSVDDGTLDETEAELDAVGTPESEDSNADSDDDSSLEQSSEMDVKEQVSYAKSLEATDRQLVVLAVDCSVEDPFTSALNSPVSSHAENIGNFLEQILKVGQDEVDIGIVAYSGLDDGIELIQSRIENAPSTPYFPASQLECLALRMDSFIEELPNGAGGLITIPHNRPVMLDLEASTYCSPLGAFAEVAETVNAWQSENDSKLAPIVVHLTRGEFETGDLEAALNKFREMTHNDPVLIYHWVSSEKPVVVKYASSSSKIEGDGSFLNGLVAISSPLQNAEQISEETPSIAEDAIGVVCNSRFDHILDPLTRSRESTGSVL